MGLCHDQLPTDDPTPVHSKTHVLKLPILKNPNTLEIDLLILCVFLNKMC